MTNANSPAFAKATARQVNDEGKPKHESSIEYPGSAAYVWQLPGDGTPSRDRHSEQ
jgi:hypothetical protein